VNKNGLTRLTCDIILYYGLCSAETDAEDSLIEMTGAAKCVSYYGVADLNEILSAILLNSTCDLAASRSVKVKHYFQVAQSRIFWSLLLMY